MLPFFFICSRRILRAETTAISEPENTPLAMISTKISTTTKIVVDMLDTGF